MSKVINITARQFGKRAQAIKDVQEHWEKVLEDNCGLPMPVRCRVCGLRAELDELPQQFPRCPDCTPKFGFPVAMYINRFGEKK